MFLLFRAMIFHEEKLGRRGGECCLVILTSYLTSHHVVPSDSSVFQVGAFIFLPSRAFQGLRLAKSCLGDPGEAYEGRARKPAPRKALSSGSEGDSSPHMLRDINLGTI